MSKFKEINHNFKIGDTVYILKDCYIKKGIVAAIEAKIKVDTKVDNIQNLIDYSTKTYLVCLVEDYFDSSDVNFNHVFNINGKSYYKDYYNYSKVYDNIDDLLYDLRKTAEI